MRKRNVEKYAILRAVMIPDNTGKHQYIPLELSVSIIDDSTKQPHVEYISLVKTEQIGSLPKGLPAYFNKETLLTAPDIIDVITNIMEYTKNKILICENNDQLIEYLKKILGEYSTQQNIRQLSDLPNFV